MDASYVVHYELVRHSQLNLIISPGHGNIPNNTPKRCKKRNRDWGMSRTRDLRLEDMEYAPLYHLSYPAVAFLLNDSSLIFILVER